MPHVPAGWTVANIGDVTSSIRTVNPREYPETEFKYVDIGSIDNASLTIVDPKVLFGRNAPSRARRLIREGDVLFSTVRTYLRNVALVPNSLDGHVASTGLAVLRANNAVLGEYLFRWVSSPAFLAEISRAQDGTLYPAVRVGDVWKAKVPLAPVSEQRRIVNKLRRLFERMSIARGELEATLSDIKKYRQKVLEHSFDLLEEKMVLGELLRGIASGKSVRCEERPPTPSENGVLKVSAVTWGEFAPHESKTLPRHFVPPPKAKVSKGDLLISRSNTRELVGSVVLVAETPDNLYLSDKVLRLETETRDRSWLLWYLRSPRARVQLEARASGTQASMKNISQRKLLDILVPYPEKDVREGLVATIEAAMTRAGAIAWFVRQAIAALDSLEGRLLDLAFTGGLTSREKQDEPVSIHLARAIQEREVTAETTVRHERVRTMAGIKGEIRRLVAEWPESGMTFEELRRITGNSYEQLKEELFELISGNTPTLYQEFRVDDEYMRIKRVEQ